MKILRIVYIQLFFCMLIFLALTVFRFFDNSGFSEFSKIYSKYAYYDTDISLVYEGKND